MGDNRKHPRRKCMVGEGYTAGLLENDGPWIEQLTKALESRGFRVVVLRDGETVIEDAFVARLDFLILGLSPTPNDHRSAIESITHDPRTFPIPKLKFVVDSVEAGEWLCTVVDSDGLSPRRTDLAFGSGSDSHQEPLALDDMLTQMSSWLRRRDRRGELMVQHWLQRQQMAEFEELVLDNLKKRFTEQIGALLRAVGEDDLGEAKTRAHTMKGWTGSLMMDEVYRAVVAVETSVISSNPDRSHLREQAYQLSELLYRIPAAYLTAETSSVSTGSPPDGTTTARRTTDNRLPKSPRHDLSTLRILLVDDDEISRALVGRLLTRCGCQYDEAENGQEALNKLRPDAFDLVLLDLEMPVFDGWKTIRAIREDEGLRRLFVVALTAHTVKEALEGCVEAGFDGFLSKPIDEGNLTRSIQALLESTEVDD